MQEITQYKKSRTPADRVGVTTSLVEVCQQAVASHPELVSDLQLPCCWWERQLLFRHPP